MTTKDNNISTTDNNTSAKILPAEKDSFSKMVEPATLSKKTKWLPALENLFEEAFGMKYKPSTVSEIMSAMDMAEAKKFFKNQRKGYTADYFLNPLTNSAERAHTKKVSVRLRRKDWNSIDAIVTDSDNCMIKTYGKYSLFLAFLIYCRQKGISFPKKSLPPLSQPLFHVAGNKTWLKDVFCQMIEQLLQEKDITTTLDLFGGSGALTNFIADYCFLNNNLILDLRFNDIDFAKRNFFKCFQESPESFMAKCEKLLDSYDYHRENNNNAEIREIINYAKTFMGKKGIHGAVAFWFSNILDENDEIISTRRKSLEDFKYVAELYNLNKVIVEKKNDIFYHLKKWGDNEKAFIMVDPPYPFTRGYQHAKANEDFNLANHIKLCEKLVTAKATWVYFGRTDAPRSYYGDEDKEKLAEKDAQHLAFLDNSFQDKGLYFMDMKSPNHTTIERLVSNVAFKGFNNYESTSSVDDGDMNLSIEVATENIELNEENIVPLIEEKNNIVDVVSEDIDTVVSKKAKKKAKKNTLKKVLRRVFNRRL